MKTEVATIHEGRTISLEAATLLGVAFTISDRTIAYRIVPEGLGLRVECRLTDRPDVWERTFTTSVKHIKDKTLTLVTFHAEEELPWYT